MKLHHLTVTAFGPFAGTESVDFDALNDAGLFLLSGATGAGKTSILDAVCFALYGAVPGVRGVKTLKSQHAQDDTQPEVVLEFSVRERRFRIRRSPEWSRPKRRGTGTLTEKASASLAELTGGDEHFLTSRAAEVGLMVSELIGMRAAQFQQVAMLPQGDFQRFLHASSQDRHEVLQHLFQTDRFSRIEDWVNDHSRKLRQQSEGGETTVQQLLHTLAERAESDLPDELTDQSSSAALSPEAALRWAREVLAAAQQELVLRQVAHATADATSTEARDRLDARRRIADAVRRRDAAQARLTALEASAAQAERAEAALKADARAAACLPFLDLLDRAVSDLTTATRARDTALAGLSTVELPDLLPVLMPDHEADAPSAEQLEEAEVRARTLLTQVDGLLPRARLLATTTSQLDATVRELEETAATHAGAVQTRDALPERIAQARADLEANATVASRREAIALQVDAAKARAEAAGGVAGAEAQLRVHQDIVRDRRDAAADAREVVQTLAARRLAGIAAELAGRLEDGHPCQVCGSAEHPAPAGQGPDPVTDGEQEAAESAYVAAQEALLVASESATTAERRLETLRDAAAGRSAEQALAELAALAAEQQAAETAEAERVQTHALVAELDGSLAHAKDAVATLDTALATLRQRRSTLETTLTEVRQEIADLLGDVDPGSLAPLGVTLKAAVAALAGARTAVVEHQRAAARLADLEAQAAATVAEHGFTSVAEVRAAALGADDRAGLEGLLAERTDLAAAARAVLADPDVLATGAAPAPDLVEEQATATSADEAAQVAARAFHLQEQRTAALGSLADRLAEALESWAPVREEFVRAESMSRLVRGMGTDNQLQMRLSAYVLATRLDQVLDAANERLSHMRDQRYLLQRTGRAARRGSQAGLGLEVVDQWTGDVREPATLSGGETFVVSLSLALGLADVVTQEAGGTEIETLFVDEGFGTLDADTLDDVMDRLDGLRAGGRTVGVVSHVSELRTRIPAQLHVRKSPQGSTIHAETLVG
ncbi:MAG: AAA family ATPase [Nocardioides sp.]